MPRWTWLDPVRVQGQGESRTHAVLAPRPTPAHGKARPAHSHTSSQALP